MTKRTPEHHLNIDRDLFDASKWDGIKETAVVKGTVDKGTADLQTFPEMVEDTFNAFFKHSVQFKEPAQIDPTYQLNRGFLEEAIGTSQYQQLRAYTRLNEAQAATAAATLGEEMIKVHGDDMRELNKYLAQLQEHAKNAAALEKELKKLAKGLKKLPPMQQHNVQRQQAQLQQKLQQTQQVQQQLQQQAQQCAGKMGTNVTSMLKSALGSIQLQEDLLAGWGTEAGGFKPVDYKTRLALAGKLLKSPNLLKIARLAGRFTRIAVRKQKMRTKHITEEISDIVQSADINRVIPSESMLLADPDLEVLFTKKFLEGQLLTYELSGQEPKGKGPLVICIDVSGSMTGEKDVWCKAVALALIQVAHKEKRDAVVIPFDTQVGTAFEFRRGESTLEKALEMAAYFTGGGTNFDPPLTKAMQFLVEDPKLKNADVVCVTDGDGHLSPKVQAEFQAVKERVKTQMITVVIGAEYGYVQHSLKPLSDFLYPVQELDENVAETVFEAI